jgi:phage-related tail fiber protein
MVAVCNNPGDEQTSLVNERFRTQLNSLKLSDTENIIIAEMIIPPEVGGFTIREAALFDDAGVCMAVANVPETYKPALAEGSGRFTILRIWLAVSSTEAVELVVDPGIVLATVEDVINAGNEIKDYTDEQLSEHADHEITRCHAGRKGFTRSATPLTAAIRIKPQPARGKAGVESAIRAAWELDNPVGTVKFYAQNVTPMSAIRGRNGFIPGKTKLSVSVKPAVQTSVRPAAAIPSRSSGLTCQPCRLM